MYSAVGVVAYFVHLISGDMHGVSIVCLLLCNAAPYLSDFVQDGEKLPMPNYIRNNFLTDAIQPHRHT